MIGRPDRRRRWRLTIVGVAAALLAVGCSSSSSSTASTPSSSAAASSAAASTASSGAPTSSAAASGTPIKVGVMCSCSGAPGFTTYNVPAEQVVEAWADATNAAGGIDGHPIKLITENDNINPGTAVTDVKSLAAQNVVDIIDISSIDAAWATTDAAAKIPVTGVYETSAAFESNPYFYPEGQTNSGINSAMTAIAKQAGATNIGILYCAESPICAQLVPGMSPSAKANGDPVVYSSQISATAPSYTAQCLAAKQAGVTALFIGDSETIQARVASDCDSQGYDPIFLTQGQGGGEGLFTTPGLKDHMVSEYGDIPFFASSPVVTAFNAAMNKYQPGVTENKNLFTQNAFLGWVSMNLFAAGLKAGGLTASTDATAALEIKGLNSLDGETLDGTAPPLTFGTQKSHVVSCYLTVRVQHSTPKLSSDTYSCPS
jgi:branched-chain amino acid transport system substrate-binding protein